MADRPLREKRRGPQDSVPIVRFVLSGILAAATVLGMLLTLSG